MNASAIPTADSQKLILAEAMKIVRGETMMLPTRAHLKALADECERLKAVHTPGPWREGKWGGSVVSDTPIQEGVPGSEDVDYYGGYLIGDSIAVCNRPIIIAAPDMLAALTELLAQVDQRCGGRIEGTSSLVTACNAARAAIAKAEAVQS